MKPQTLYEKIWNAHVVAEQNDNPTILYIDTHFIHEVTSPQAFSHLRKKHLEVRRTDLTFATCDHNVSTVNQSKFDDEMSRIQIQILHKNCKDFDIKLFGLGHPNQGIVHVIGPQLGITQPGKTIVCGDSHTSTHGAFGALAFGIGTTEVAHVLATQCLLQHRMKTMEIRITGKLGKGVYAKDVILTILSKIGTKGGSGYCIEYTGSVIQDMDMDGRMTVCNMSIEGGARAGLIAPDETTFAYLKEKLYSPTGSQWEKALSYWKTLPTDKDAVYDKQIIIDGNQIEPLITWGTDPSTAMRISDSIPDPKNALNEEEKQTMENALRYMNFKPKMRLDGFPVDYVFIGSCTNGRFSDLQDAARILKGRKIHKNVIAWIVPGSQFIKKQAEQAGLDKIFIDAGCQWRWPGCSACIAMNEDKIPAGKYCVSTSNRNFQGRQGEGSRTILASPATAAACALEGKIADVRKYS
jgi:3-isopropylmalate/(R)-2-methylmalate dehydratase large subunit